MVLVRGGGEDRGGWDRCYRRGRDVVLGGEGVVVVVVWPPTSGPRWPRHMRPGRAGRGVGPAIAAGCFPSLLSGQRRAGEQGRRAVRGLAVGGLALVRDRGRERSRRGGFGLGTAGSSGGTAASGGWAGWRRRLCTFFSLGGCPGLCLWWEKAGSRVVTDESEVVVRWMLSSLPEGNPGARFDPQVQQLP